MYRILDKSLLIGLGLLIIMLVAIAALNFKNTHQLNEDAQWVAHTHEVLDLTSDVLLTLVNAETGQRGFLLTGKEEFLRPYNEALKQFDGQMATLKAKTNDNDRQLNRIHTLEEMANERLELLKKGIALRRKGDMEGQTFFKGNKGKSKMDSIRKLIAAMEQEEMNLLKERQERSEVTYRTAVVSNLLVTFVGLVLVGALALILQRNLAARQRAAATIHNQQEWFRTTLASIGDAVIATDTEGKVVFMNGVAQAMTGWSADDAKGQPLETVFSIVSEESRAQVGNPAMRALKEGTIVGLANHTLLISKGGNEYLIDDSAAPIRNEKGQVTGAVLIFRDMNEQRKAGDVKRHLSAIVESSADAIISKDLNGIVKTWNHGAELVFGYNSSEMIGQPIALLIPADQPDEEPGILQRIRRGEKVDGYETLRRRKDGRFIHVALTISPVRDQEGRIIGASKIARDITKSKRVEKQLQLLWSAAAVLLGTDDPDALLQSLFAKIGRHLGVEVYFNYLLNERGDALRLASYAGVSEEITRKITQLEFGQALCGSVAQQRKPIVMNFHQLQGDPRAELNKEMGVRAFACFPLQTKGNFLGTLSFGSRSKDSFEEDELELIKTVCHYVTVSFDRLRLIRQLQESDRRKDEFLATLAHELRNPLAPIRNALQIMRLEDGNESLTIPVREIIDRQVRHLVRLVDDLLDLSRITRGKITLLKERLQVSAVIENALETSRPVIDAAGHELTVHGPTQSLWVMGDLTRLAQIVSNLINNAVKYTPDRGHIWLTIEEQDRQAVIRVKDNGIGIPAEMLPKVFEMFTQIDRHLDRSHGGLGIGLSLVRRLVEMHGGTVDAHSAGAGQGSEFIVRLPLAPEDLARDGAEDTKTDDAAIKPKGRRILVVDDSIDSAESLATLLRIIGNEVHMVHDGPTALGKAKEFRPEVVLLDIGLPGMNGYEVARKMREMPEVQEALLIAQTGWGQEEDRRRSKEAGFNYHMVKPVDLDTLQKLLG